MSRNEWSPAAAFAETRPVRDLRRAGRNPAARESLLPALLPAGLAGRSAPAATWQAMTSEAWWIVMLLASAVALLVLVIWLT